MTIPSRPKQLVFRSDLTGGLLITAGKSAVVTVNDNYIDSDEYLAMFLGCLALQPHDERRICIRNVWMVMSTSYIQKFTGTQTCY